MTRFEYLVVHSEGERVLSANGHWQGIVERDEPGSHDSCPHLHAYLAEAGAQGWELVAVDPEEVGSATLYFKRAHQG